MNVFLRLCQKWNRTAPDLARRALKIRCKTDLELFARVYFPHYCGLPFNQFHQDTFDTFRPDKRGARRVYGAPRGYAKSTFKALIELVHDVCYGTEKFVVVISNTQPQANSKLKDIRREILTNGLLIEHYEISFDRKTPAETQFVAKCGENETLFAAYGAGAEIRGIRFGADRPSKIVCDDVEHSEEVNNEQIRSKYRDWYFEVVSQIGDTQTNIHFVGTVLHPQSLLMELLQNPIYDAKLYKAIISWSLREDLWEQWRKLYTNLDDLHRANHADTFYRTNKAEMLRGTRVLWPDKEPYLYLMQEIIEKGRRAFLKEKQNEPLGNTERLFEEIRWYRETSEGFLIEKTGVLIPWSQLKSHDGTWLNAYGALDPATGQTKARGGKLGDYSCILSGILDGKDRLFVHGDWTRRAAPTQWISEVFEHNEIYDYQKFGVETNLYRDLLLPNMEAERKRWEYRLKKTIRLPFYDIQNVDNKEKRIYTLEPKISHGHILFNRALSKTFVNMLEEFPHGDHDDGPDALEMLWGIVRNRYKASSLPINSMISR